MRVCVYVCACARCTYLIMSDCVYAQKGAQTANGSKASGLLSYELICQVNGLTSMYSALATLFMSRCTLLHVLELAR